jgi:NADH-quinone oxidoreductase subunit C
MSLVFPATQQVVTSLQTRFGTAIQSVTALKPTYAKVMVESSRLMEVAAFLKEVGLDHVISMGGTDYPKDNQIEVFYHAASVSKEELKRVAIILATRVARDHPVVPTSTSIWPSAEYHEREAYEMLGVVFTGHPNLKPLLLPEDWSEIPPLRKEFHLPGR